MVRPYLIFLALLAVERLVELAISRRNVAWALERGGMEFGRRHFRFMKVLHTSFLFSCAGEVLWLERPFYPLLGWSMLALELAAQGLRYWAVASLGRFWNVRIVVVPGAPAVTTGPYRHIRHPNYLAVIVEGFTVPLIHTAWVTAVAFTVLNAVLLCIRISCEEEALATHCRYRERLADRPRLVLGAKLGARR